MRASAAPPGGAVGEGGRLRRHERVVRLHQCVRSGVRGGPRSRRRRTPHHHNELRGRRTPHAAAGEAGVPGLLVVILLQADAITNEKLREHLTYLSSDELEVRNAGYDGNVKAGDYI